MFHGASGLKSLCRGPRSICPLREAILFGFNQTLDRTRSQKLRRRGYVLFLALLTTRKCHHPPSSTRLVFKRLIPDGIGAMLSQRGCLDTSLAAAEVSKLPPQL